MSNIIKFEIDSKIFYKDLEYIIKGYPSFDEILLKRDISLHISELPDSDAGVVPDTFAMRFSRV